MQKKAAEREGMMGRDKDRSSFLTSVDRIKRDIEILAGFSSVEGIGCTRFTYSKEFAEARDYIMEEMRKAGLSVRQDAVGTVIGRLEGADGSAPAVMTGSHFDTVKTGGRFDGMAGVSAALETARVIHENGFRPVRSIEFVALPEEEGARFGSGLFGSRAICGKLLPGELTEHKDEEGISVAEAMREYGLDPDRADEARRHPGEIGQFIELHIEQGPVLENERIDVGIIDRIVGLRCDRITVTGRADHGGNTPMDMRADSMLASARAISAAAGKAIELGGTVCTCGDIETEPGAFNIVPSETVFTLDSRSAEMDNVTEVFRTACSSLDDSAAEYRGLSYESVPMLNAEPVPMDEHVKKIMEKNAAEAGITTRRMDSGAGHDAMIMDSICDSAMIFVPSRGGRSHVPEEWTDYEDLQCGVEVVCRTVMELAGRAE